MTGMEAIKTMMILDDGDNHADDDGEDGENNGDDGNHGNDGGLGSVLR